MHSEERRKQGNSRIIGLHDQTAYEPDLLATSTPQARMEALWDLTLEYLAWTRPNECEARLQRSICRIEHCRGMGKPNRLSLWRPTGYGHWAERIDSK